MWLLNSKKVFPKRLWLQGIQYYVQNMGSKCGLSLSLLSYTKDVGFFTRIKNLLRNDFLSQRKNHKTCGLVVSKAPLHVSYSVLAQSDRPTKMWNCLLLAIVSGFGGGQIQNYSPGRNSKYPLFIIFFKSFYSVGNSFSDYHQVDISNSKVCREEIIVCFIVPPIIFQNVSHVVSPRGE